MDWSCFLCGKRLGRFKEKYTVKDFQSENLPPPSDFNEHHRICASCFNRFKIVEFGKGMSGRKKVGIVLLSLFIVFFVIPLSIAGYYDYDLRVNNPEQYALDEAQRRQQQAFEERQKATEIEIQKKQEASSIQKLKGLPASCDGVDSTETRLYPTGEKCIRELEERFYDWCLSKEKKLAEKGAEARAGLCMAEIDIRLADTCRDPVFSSREVCEMSTLKYLYRELIPE